MGCKFLASSGGWEEIKFAAKTTTYKEAVSNNSRFGDLRLHILQHASKNIEMAEWWYKASVLQALFGDSKKSNKAWKQACNSIDNITEARKKEEEKANMLIWEDKFGKQADPEVLQRIEKALKDGRKSSRAAPLKRITPSKKKRR